MSPIRKTFQYGEHTVTLEVGEIARQASGAVMVNMADTMVLVTAVGRDKGIPGRDFFPMTVDYQERTYAAGKIPGGFFRRRHPREDRAAPRLSRSRADRAGGAGRRGRRRLHRALPAPGQHDRLHGLGQPDAG